MVYKASDKTATRVTGTETPVQCSHVSRPGFSAGATRSSVGCRRGRWASSLPVSLCMDEAVQTAPLFLPSQGHRLETTEGAVLTEQTGSCSSVCLEKVQSPRTHSEMDSPKLDSGRQTRGTGGHIGTALAQP